MCARHDAVSSTTGVLGGSDMSNDEGKKMERYPSSQLWLLFLLAFLILQIIRQRRSYYFYDHPLTTLVLEVIYSN